jgi:hypothetical protein
LALPVAWRCLPPPFFPPPYFMQKLLIDTTNLCEQRLGTVVISLLGSFWLGVLAMKCVCWIWKTTSKDGAMKYD